MTASARCSTASKAGDVVADLFGGSGSTLIGCERRGRHARLVCLVRPLPDSSPRWDRPAVACQLLADGPLDYAPGDRREVVILA
jgi:hypothetical protein